MLIISKSVKKLVINPIPQLLHHDHIDHQYRWQTPCPCWGQVCTKTSSSQSMHSICLQLISTKNQITKAKINKYLINQLIFIYIVICYFSINVIKYKSINVCIDLIVWVIFCWFINRISRTMPMINVAFFV